jgi:phosphoserine phosphatase
MRKTASANSKQHVLLDWDGVLRPGFLIIDWAAHLQDRKAFAPSELQTMRDQLLDYQRGRLSYPEIAKGIPAHYGEGLKGFDVNEHQRIAVEYILSEEFRSSLSPLGNLILDFLRRAPTLDPIIVSGAPGSVLRPFGATCGVEHVWAVEIEIEDDIFTGRILDNPAVRERKEQLIAERLATESILLGVGDSESDYPMLNAATYRIAIGNTIAQEWDGRKNTMVLREGADQDRIEEIRSFLFHMVQQ